MRPILCLAEVNYNLIVGVSTHVGIPACYRAINEIAETRNSPGIDKGNWLGG